jgi:sodium/potassium-transporting ATPase subunit alpha
MKLGNSLSFHLHRPMLQREPPALYSDSSLDLIISRLPQVFAVKAKFSFPFGKSIVGNKYNFLGILAGGCLGIFIIYTPPLHVVFGGSYHLSPLYWLIPCAFGVLLLIWASIRVLLLRKSIEQSRVKDIKGLMMCELQVLWKKKRG